MDNHNQDSTYSRLIETGVRLFGEYGYDAVSIRDIVRDSGANLSAVSYHFGGKAEMYKAVVGYLLDEVTNQLRKFNAEQFSNMTLPEMEQRLPEIIISFRELFCSPNGMARLNIFVRETTSPDSNLSHTYFLTMINTVRSFFQQILGAYYRKRGESDDKVNFVISILMSTLKHMPEQRHIPCISAEEREDNMRRLINLIVTCRL